MSPGCATAYRAVDLDMQRQRAVVRHPALLPSDSQRVHRAGAREQGSPPRAVGVHLSTAHGILSLYSTAERARKWTESVFLGQQKLGIVSTCASSVMLALQLPPPTKACRPRRQPCAMMTEPWAYRVRTSRQLEEVGPKRCDSCNCNLRQTKPQCD